MMRLKTHTQVLNPRDPLADSKHAWEPIYSELTIFLQEVFSSGQKPKQWKIIDFLASK